MLNYDDVTATTGAMYSRDLCCRCRHWHCRTSQQSSAGLHRSYLSN